MCKISRFIILFLCFISAQALRSFREENSRVLIGEDDENKNEKNEKNERNERNEKNGKNEKNKKNQKNENTNGFPTYYSAYVTNEEPIYRGPSSCPSNLFKSGYSNLRRMMLDMSSGTENTFNICPGTVFDLRQDSVTDGETGIPLIIPFDNVTINCGEDGSFGNKCILDGGLIQIALGGKNITLNGLRFTGSTGISVLGIGSSDSSATFNDCAWKNNSGYSAVYSQYMNEKVLEKSMTDPELIESFMIDKGESPVGTKVKKNGMNLSFSNCFFKENTFSTVVMHAKRSAVNLANVMFQENNGDMADIILAYGSEMTMKIHASSTKGINY